MMKNERPITLSLALLTALGASLGVGVALGARSAWGEAPSFRRLNPPDRKDGLPFTHTIVAGETIYLAGTLGLDPKTGRPPADPAEEARLALEGIEAKLALAGATMDDLVSVQVFCSDLSLYSTFNEVYATVFTPGHFPTRAFLGSSTLLRGARFEIVGIAVKSS